MLGPRPRWPAGSRSDFRYEVHQTSIGSKEANYVSSSWIRFASAVAGRLLHVPRHRILYPHSPDIGRCFYHLPFHAGRSFCGLRFSIGGNAVRTK